MATTRVLLPHLGQDGDLNLRGGSPVVSDCDGRRPPRSVTSTTTTTTRMREVFEESDGDDDDRRGGGSRWGRRRGRRVRSRMRHRRRCGRGRGRGRWGARTATAADVRPLPARNDQKRKAWRTPPPLPTDDAVRGCGRPVPPPAAPPVPDDGEGEGVGSGRGGRWWRRTIEEDRGGRREHSAESQRDFPDRLRRRHHLRWGGQDRGRRPTVHGCAAGALPSSPIYGGHVLALDTISAAAVRRQRRQRTKMRGGSAVVDIAVHGHGGDDTRRVGHGGEDADDPIVVEDPGQDAQRRIDFVGPRRRRRTRLVVNDDGEGRRNAGLVQPRSHRGTR
jgi:hypothetical protein